MDFLKLKYFCITAKWENMSLAAKELLISQPALSKAITNLEAELEMDLFFRNGKRISLNENGRFLFKRAERIFSELHHLERGLEERRGEGSGNLSIVTTLPYTFTNIVDLFFNEYPHVKYLQVPLSKENLQQFIENGKYDVCITTEKIDHPNVEWVPLFEEEIFLTVPKSYKEAKTGTIDLMELDNLPFIGLTKGYSFRQFTDQFCKSVGYTPNYRVEVEEATTILQLVKNGRGAAFTPETSVNLYEDKIKHLKIKNRKFTRTIGLLKHRYLYPTKISEAFVAHCHRYFQDAKKKNSRF
ncbi:DNA-binding transcriptional LysR family regulator [Neobacillus niacini]|uniref:LysR family transcriptional regulator n=1 Tax=Neobacillus niacini TaxID=86668 RepID=UPI002855E984|nr:LysR family transcriptional regulator [Neobacillus niacini]MDR7080135.1 DNA-binding transcriptional LysR family regulator [Neobacillus niacini]